MCLKGKGGFMQCPSVVAVSSSSREVVAIGQKARSMLGKTPEGISVIRPVQEGIIADPDATTKMLRIFFEEAGVISFFSRPSVIASIPFGESQFYSTQS
jgi:rod shape-determining protein MreB